MSDANFLTPTLEPSNLPAGKKIRKKAVRKKPAKVPVRKTGKVSFKLNKNLDTAPVMPKAEMEINENLPIRKKTEGNIYFKIVLSFVALTIILVLAVMYFGFSKVTLVIVPTQEKIADSLSLKIIDKDKNIAAGQNQLQGIVKQVPMEQSRTFVSSGKEVLGEEVTGQVTIFNSYLKNQPLVATTRLLGPDNKLFRLKNTVNVPAGGKVEAEIYADEAKPEMAIGPSRFTIPGLWAGLQDKIYAVSSEPMKYSKKIKHIIQQIDIDSAVSELKNGLLDNSKKELGQAYGEYDQRLFEIDNNSINQAVAGKVGEEKESFTINMKTKVTIVAFKGSEAFNQATAKLDNTLADDKEIMEFGQRDMIYNPGQIDLKQGSAEVNANYTAKVTLKDSAGIIKKNNLAGLSEEQLKTYLNGLPEIAGYEIKFFPSFIRKVPKLADRIEVVIKK